jgi:hypothetical protein
MRAILRKQALYCEKQEARMNIRLAIQQMLDRLDDDELAELLPIIEQFVAAKEREKGPSLMDSLREIKIDGPEDFSRNIDHYLYGVKRVEPHPR